MLFHIVRIHVLMMALNIFITCLPTELMADDVGEISDDEFDSILEQMTDLTCEQSCSAPPGPQKGVPAGSNKTVRQTSTANLPFQAGMKQTFINKLKDETFRRAVLEKNLGKASLNSQHFSIEGIGTDWGVTIYVKTDKNGSKYVTEAHIPVNVKLTKSKLLCRGTLIMKLSSLDYPDEFESFDLGGVITNPIAMAAVSNLFYEKIKNNSSMFTEYKKFSANSNYTLQYVKTENRIRMLVVEKGTNKLIHVMSVEGN